jgi:steroid delta-isomerase-like uncharacterized protein
MNPPVLDQLIAAIEAGDVEGYGRCYLQDAVMQGPLFPEPYRGRQAIEEGEAALYEAFSDVALEVRSVLGAGDRVAAEVVLNATNDGPLDLGMGEPLPATGRRVSLPAVWLFELADGRIAEERDYFDTALLLQQLGLAEE